MTELWEGALSALRGRVSPESFETWLEPLVLMGVDGDRAILRIPNRFHADWLTAHYLDLLREAVQKATGRDDLKISWEIDESAVQRDRSARRTPSIPPASPVVAGTTDLGRSTGLNPKYTFDNFIVGPSNELAHASAIAAASTPGKRNPLFIYGGVGLGKTHLVNAVGHRVKAEKPGARVLYLSAERFTNEFIWALQNHKIADFRERYRESCDLLLMDDIQFLAGREQTQEEFFHTFNDLYSQHRQIILTSDRSPKYLPGIEDRLRSRFEWGLTADIQPPDLETRTAILQAKAREQGVPLPSEVASLIARRALENIRELEGHLNRVVAFHQLTQQPITVELVNVALEGITPARRNLPQPQAIIDAVVKLFRVPVEDLTGPRREQKLAYARHLAMYLLYEGGLVMAGIMQRMRREEQAKRDKDEKSENENAQA